MKLVVPFKQNNQSSIDSQMLGAVYEQPFAQPHLLA